MSVVGLCRGARPQHLEAPLGGGQMVAVEHSIPVAIQPPLAVTQLGHHSFGRRRLLLVVTIRHFSNSSAISMPLGYETPPDTDNFPHEISRAWHLDGAAP